LTERRFEMMHLRDLSVVFLAAFLWLVLSLVGLLLPITIGLVFFMVIAPIVGGYVAGRTGRVGSLAIVLVVTTVLAGLIGLATVGSAPADRQRNITGIGVSSDALILVWIGVNGILTLIAGFFRFRSIRRSSV
jgi:hypothetical protein